MKKMVKLNNRNDWELLLKEACHSSEIIIFKSSPYCGTSALCEKIFNEWFYNLCEDTEITCVKIDVIEARPLSNLIAAEFGVRHESPQVIWLDTNSKVKWHQSHLAITEDALTGLITY
jgi:bacillithiol system protein YtxJ